MEGIGHITVVIVEGNQFLRSGIRQVLQRQPDMEVVAEFEHAATAIAEINDLRPDVVLVSSTLADMPGFAACVRLMDAAPVPRVIMMCPAITDVEVFASRMAGAGGCLMIGGAVEDLVRTVRANGRAEMFHIRLVAECVLRFAQYRPRYVDISLLTDRDKQVMRLVADGFSNGAIAAELGLTRYTVRNYVSVILGKLGLASRTEIGALVVLLGVLDQGSEGGTGPPSQITSPPLAMRAPRRQGLSEATHYRWPRGYGGMDCLEESAMEETHNVTVVIVEGNQFLRSGIRQALQSHPDIEVVAEFEHGASAVAEINDLRPDVVLVSSTLADMPGFAACVRLMDAAPVPRVIMMCPAITDVEVFAGWMAGAAGCLMIGGAVEDLVRTVRANGRGEMFHIRLVSECILRLAQHKPRYVDISLLTDREKQVMRLVADGFNNGAIAAELGLTRYTVRNYVSVILGKLGLASRTELGALGVLMGVLDQGSEGGTGPPSQITSRPLGTGDWYRPAISEANY